MSQYTPALNDRIRYTPGNVGGVQTAALGTTEMIFDLSAWKGETVRILVAGPTPADARRVDYVFSDQSSGTVLDTSEALDSASPLMGAADWIDDGQDTREVVPVGKPFLHVVSNDVSTRVKIRPAWGVAQYS